MEVFTSVVLLQIVIAIRLIIKNHVSRNRDVPEDVNVTKNDDEPM